MDVEKLKQWLQFAQQVQGSGDFWNSIFDNDNAGMFSQNSSTNKPSSFNMENTSVPNNTIPLIDIFSDEQNIYVIASFPGVYKEDINLAVANDTLILKRMLKPVLENVQAISSERKVGPFERMIKLPEPVDTTNINAKYSNGLLLITLQRFMKNAEPIHID